MGLPYPGGPTGSGGRHRLQLPSKGRGAVMGNKGRGGEHGNAGRMKCGDAGRVKTMPERDEARQRWTDEVW